MQSIPTIVGLPNDGKIRTVCHRITRVHLLVIALVFVGLLSLSLLVTVIVQARNSRQTDNEYCLTDGCISAANYQLRSMDKNASLNSCTDFYSYACGGWQDKHLIQSFDVERTILGDIINRRDADIERLLNAPIARVDQRGWEYKLKTYYAECRDDYARVPDSGRDMVALIQDRDTVDGWFIFDNSAENASQEFLLKNQSVYKQMAHIHGDLGVLGIFGLRTRFNETNPNIKQLEFFPAGLSLEVNDYLNNDTSSVSRLRAYQSYIVEVVGLLAGDAGVTDANLRDRAFTVANDVYTVERFLAESLQRASTNIHLSMMTLKAMSAQFSFDFVRLMAHEVDDASSISETSIVYVNNLMYFTDIFEFLDNDADPLFARMIHNYLRWRLVWTYIDDLSFNYVHAHRVFLNSYYNYPLHSTNEAYCTREVIRRFPLAIQRLYTMNSITHPTAVQTVQTLFNSLKEGFQQYIAEQATWMDDEPTKSIARGKIDALTAAIGYASIALDDGQLDNYYDKFIVGSSSHFQNAFSYHRFHRWTLSNALKYPNALEHWDLFETRTSRLFDYIALFNRLFVVASALHEPLFQSDWPCSMNIGSIGVLLAQKLFASIDMPEGRTHLANGTRVSDWWSSSTSNGYNNSRNCITDYYVRDLKTVAYMINGVPIQVQLAGEPFSPITLRHIGALRLAYNALMKMDSTKSFRMPGTSLNSKQTFFLAYAQTQCFRRDGLIQLLSAQLGTYDERTALNTALIHMPEFAQAFQCQAREKTCF